MQADKAAGRQRTRGEYTRVLAAAGHKGSAQSAGLILAREAKRVFGRTLGRQPRAVAPKPAARQRGRKPSPATQALIEAMHADKASGKQRTRGEYAQVLASAGHKGSSQSASIILAREAKRVFGRTLGRERKAARASAGGQRGRKPAPHTVKLRERLAADQTAGKLGDAQHYTRWLVDHSKLGLKQARPIVYRELRTVA